MIKPISISVDEATRQVLDELTESLGRAPDWASQLTRNLPDSIREVLDDELAPLAGRLDQMKVDISTVQSRLSEQGSLLQRVAQELQSSAGQSQARLVEQGGLLQRMQQDSQVNGEQLQASWAAFAHRHEALLGEQRNAMTQFAVVTNAKHEELHASLSTLASTYRDEFNKLTSAQGLTLDLMRQMAKSVEVQQQALTKLQEQIRTLQQPWWKKLFGG